MGIGPRLRVCNDYWRLEYGRRWQHSCHRTLSKSEIDVYADGYVDDLYGYSGFGTSYATPAVAAETMNLLYSVVSGKGFQSESEISEFLFDVITPGFQSPDMWADAVTDLITTDVKVNFTNGKSEIVKVMTSDLEQNGTLEPSQIYGSNGENNYWGSW